MQNEVAKCILKPPPQKNELCAAAKTATVQTGFLFTNITEGTKGNKTSLVVSHQIVIKENMPFFNICIFKYIYLFF